MVRRFVSVFCLLFGYYSTARPFLGPIPLGHDLNRASGLVRFFTHWRKVMPTVSSDIWDDLWDTFVRRTAFNETSRVLASFHHDDPTELPKLLRGDTTLTQLRRQQATQTPEWLNEYGTCGDHLKAQPSTLSQAGRGAFTSRDLPQGTLVAALPLIHLTNRSLRDRFDPFQEEPEQDADSPIKRPPQLLLNYCFGHNESSLLLCPYGPISSYM